MKHLNEALSKSMIKKIKKNNFDAKNIIFLLPSTVAAIEHLKRFVADDCLVYEHPTFFILTKENAIFAIDELKAHNFNSYYLFRLTNPEKYSSFTEIRKDAIAKKITVKYPPTPLKNTEPVQYHQIIK